ncbi:hypothetical protein Rhopal_007619-T1 [Rhodotorula paludigena]|uniref:Uncharacterized protein n=1 Tax=Rhodotorula paludigena TaxID=86838 RepID=A0AAV5GQ67_9BASI|nr:hypothetical protein Rhopal_007619-T1 [Rhodotorula paludigena]
MITDHGYPRNTGIIQREIEISQRFFKNFLIGEYDWTTTQSSVSLDAYLALIEANKPNIGDMIWNVMGHEPDDSMYYPNGNSLADQANILKVVQHWYRMRNLTPPSQLVGVTLPQPEF